MLYRFFVCLFGFLFLVFFLQVPFIYDFFHSRNRNHVFCLFVCLFVFGLFFVFVFVLFCFVLFCFVLFCFVLFCFVLFCFEKTMKKL